MSDPCFAKPGLLTVDQALDILLVGVQAKCPEETVQILDTQDRVLSRPLYSSMNVPPLDNSAMDGYAVMVGDIAATGETRLPVAQRIPAGVCAATLEPGTAARIFTGAPVPPGADAVVMQERCRQDGNHVIIQGQVRAGEHIRRAGEDITAGAEILAAGVKMRPQEMGLAASVGLSECSVYRRLRVAVFSSGNELVEPGTALVPGQIYNSNRYMLAGLLQRTGCEITDLGTVEDSLDATRRALEDASRQADLILTSGGVSVGEEDYIKTAVEDLGQLDLWRVAMKPGKPLAFGRVHDTPFLGLPGNPVSVFVTYCLFARPCILRMQGLEDVVPHSVYMEAAFEWLRTGPRREFLRARRTRVDGRECVQIYPHQGSGVLNSTVWADGLVVVPESQTVHSGDSVEFIPFSELY